MAQKSWKIEEIFPRFVNAQTAKGVSDKTVLTYNRHFRSLGYHLDMRMTFDELTKEALDSMLVSLRKSGVSPNTISSYARVFRTFLKWCRAEGYHVTVSNARIATAELLYTVFRARHLRTSLFSEGNLLPRNYEKTPRCSQNTEALISY